MWHFHQDCTTALSIQDGDRMDKLTFGISLTVGHVSHTFADSICISDLTFETILKELVSFSRNNRKPFWPKIQNTQKCSTQSTMGNVSKFITFELTANAGTTLTNTGARPAPAISSSGYITMQTILLVIQIREI